MSTGPASEELTEEETKAKIVAEMKKLPLGEECARCRWFPRCRFLHDAYYTDNVCHWAPSRFEIDPEVSMVQEPPEVSP